MANNRMWLVDTVTREKILLAKSMGNGWYMCPTLAEIDDFFDCTAWPDERYVRTTTDSPEATQYRIEYETARDAKAVELVDKMTYLDLPPRERELEDELRVARDRIAGLELELERVLGR